MVVHPLVSVVHSLWSSDCSSYVFWNSCLTVILCYLVIHLTALSDYSFKLFYTVIGIHVSFYYFVKLILWLWATEIGYTVGFETCDCFVTIQSLRIQYLIETCLFWCDSRPKRTKQIKTVINPVRNVNLSISLYKKKNKKICKSYNRQHKRSLKCAIFNSGPGVHCSEMSPGGEVVEVLVSYVKCCLHSLNNVR